MNILPLDISQIMLMPEDSAKIARLYLADAIIHRLKHFVMNQKETHT